MNTKLLRSTKDCTPIEIFLSVTSKPCPHPRTYKNRNAKPDVNCSMLVTTNILHIQWFNAMALFCRCCLPVFRKSILCLSRVFGVLAWRAGCSSLGGRRYVDCSSRQRPAPFDWRRMLTFAAVKSLKREIISTTTGDNKSTSVDFASLLEALNSEELSKLVLTHPSSWCEHMLATLPLERIWER